MGPVGGSALVSAETACCSILGTARRGGARNAGLEHALPGEHGRGHVTQLAQGRRGGRSTCCRSRGRSVLGVRERRCSSAWGPSCLGQPALGVAGPPAPLGRGLGLPLAAAPPIGSHSRCSVPWRPCRRPPWAGRLHIGLGIRQPCHCCCCCPTARKLHRRYVFLISRSEGRDSCMMEQAPHSRPRGCTHIGW